MLVNCCSSISARSTIDIVNIVALNSNDDMMNTLFRLNFCINQLPKSPDIQIPTMKITIAIHANHTAEVLLFARR